MKKYVLSILIAVMVIMPAVTLAQGLTANQVVELLISLGVIAPEKVAQARQAVTNVNSSSGSNSGPNANTSAVARNCFEFKRNLTIGDKGEDVDALVKVLVSENIISAQAGEQIKGAEYNRALSDAVKVFQERYRLEILSPARLRSGTGTVGPSTLAKLNALCRVTVAQTQNQGNASPVSSITIKSPNGGETITAGTKVGIVWDARNVSTDDEFLAGYIKEGQFSVAIGRTKVSSYEWSIPSSLEPGRYKAYVQFTTGAKRGISDYSDNWFTITAPAAQNVNSTPASVTPVISTIFPSSGPAGTSVTLTGSGFNTSSDNILNITDGQYGYSLKIRSSNGTGITFNMPANIQAGKTYKVSVDSGLVSNVVYFTATAVTSVTNNPVPVTAVTPVITYFAPESGAVGTELTIIGTGLSNTGNTVVWSAGGVHTPVTASSNGGIIKVRVPQLGAGAYLVSVGNSENKSSAFKSFTVTASASGSQTQAQNQNTGATSGTPNLLLATPTVTGAPGSGSAIYAGSMTVSTQVVNSGNASAPESKAMIQYSTDGVSFTDWETKSVPELASGASQMISHTWQGGAGVWYIKICVDRQGEVTESNENDNCSVGVRFEVVNKPTSSVYSNSLIANILDAFRVVFDR